jgi:transposase
MASIALERTDVIVGVDTHKDLHVAVAIDGHGGPVGAVSIEATNEGYAELLSWAASLGRIHGFGVEGCGSYGIGLARFLRRHGHPPVEVARPPRKGERRASGKSDAIDAEHAARMVLAGVGLATPKLADGQIESLRLLKIARDTAVKAKTTAMIALKATLVTASAELRGELEPLSNFQLITACAALESQEPVGDPGAAMHHVLGSLARRWLALHNEIKIHTRQLKQITTAVAPQLLDAYGVGFDVAAEMLVTAGDNTERVRSEAAFAELCGVCPIPAGSGKTNGRHRLNRGGNRQANAALYRTVIVRMRWHEPTIAYVERRTREGLSKREIIRCLKRYLAREIFGLLPRSSEELASLPAA